MLARTAKALAIASLAMVTTPAFADLPLVQVTGTPNTLGNGPFTLGFSFSTSKTLTVKGLGLYDFNGDGLAASHDIGLWDSTGTLLASTTLASGTGASLLDGFRFGSISSLVIGPGTYSLGAVFADGSDPNFFGGDGVLTSLAGVTFLASGYASGGTLAFPGSEGTGSPAYIGPNALIGSVPEPATWALMILGFGGVGVAMRRRAAVRTTVRFA